MVSCALSREELEVKGCLCAPRNPRVPLPQALMSRIEDASINDSILGFDVGSSWNYFLDLHSDIVCPDRPLPMMPQALDSVSRGQQKLDLAQRLTGALSSENDRWAENVVQLRAEMELLTGDVLLAASFIRWSFAIRPSLNGVNAKVLVSIQSASDVRRVLYRLIPLRLLIKLQRIHGSDHQQKSLGWVSHYATCPHVWCCFIRVGSFLQLCWPLHQALPRSAHGSGVRAIPSQRVPGTGCLRSSSALSARGVKRPVECTTDSTNSVFPDPQPFPRYPFLSIISTASRGPWRMEKHYQCRQLLTASRSSRLTRRWRGGIPTAYPATR